MVVDQPEDVLLLILVLYGGRVVLLDESDPLFGYVVDDKEGFSPFLQGMDDLILLPSRQIRLEESLTGFMCPFPFQQVEDLDEPGRELLSK